MLQEMGSGSPTQSDTVCFEVCVNASSLSGIPVSRATAAALRLNCALILLPVLRNALTLSASLVRVISFIVPG